MKWAYHAAIEGFNFEPPAGFSRQPNLKWMYNMLGNSRSLLPSPVSIQTMQGDTLDFVAFDFVPQLLSMLQDKKVMQWDNLALDPHWPFALPQQTSNCPIGECHTGSVYQMLHKKHITNPDRNQLLVPLILDADKTHVDTFGWFTLEPLVFTTAIYKEEFHCQHVAWKPLGYIVNQHHHMPPSKPLPRATTNAITIDN